MSAIFEKTLYFTLFYSINVVLYTKLIVLIEFAYTTSACHFYFDRV